MMANGQAWRIGGALLAAFLGLGPAPALAASDGNPFEPTVTRQESDILEQAVALAETELDAAIAGLRERDLKQASAALDFALGNLLYQAERYEEAAAAYRAALAKLPAFRAALNNLGRVLLLLERPAEAVAAFQALLRDGQADADMLVLLGHALLMEQHPVSAEGAYRQSLVLRPGDPDALRGLLKCLIEQGRHAEVLALSRELLRADPGAGELWALRVNAHLLLEQMDEAVAGIEVARRLDRATPALLATLGDLYLNREQPREAAAAYAAAFAQGDAIAPARVLRAAEGFMLAGALDEAARMLERARSMEPDRAGEPAPRRQRLRLEAQLALLRGDTEAARTGYGALVRDDPLDAEAMLRLAELEAVRGAYEEARLLLERAARVDGFEARALVRHAQLEVGRGRFRQAAELLESSLAFDNRPQVAQYLEQVRRLTRR